MATKILDSDIAKLYVKDNNGKKKLLVTLFWGDTIDVRREGDRYVVPLTRNEWDARKKSYVPKKYSCELSSKAKFRDSALLKVRFIDVGQGDGAMIETPAGKRVLLDGGEEEHVRRYINVAFSHVLKNGPLHCDAIIATHGDADHFAGLTRLLNGRRRGGAPMVTADYVFHNGIVKGPATKKLQMLGKTRKTPGGTWITELENDIRKVPDSRCNVPFLKWKQALQQLRGRGRAKPKVQRLEYGDGASLRFLETSDLKIQVLGPITEMVGNKPALRYLKQPGSSALSPSHTINGHSVVLKLRYGNVNFLFGADLNEESEERLLERVREDGQTLSAEILKVPHHGSADFSPRMLEAVKPVVSVVSSGDENTSKEYIHPRAGLVGALGKYSRATVPKPLVYVTEMVAFFARVNAAAAGCQLNNLYQKKQFGIVHVRTDGKRVLVVTHSGKDNQKESYVFHVDERGDITFDEKATIV